MPSASAMRLVVTWRRSHQPNTADISGISVKTAAADTGFAVFSPSNISTKYKVNSPPSTK